MPSRAPPRPGGSGQRAADQEEAASRWPQCGTRVEPHWRRTRRRRSTGGGQPLQAQREEGDCPPCGQGLFPLDEELGLLPGGRTPRRQEQLAHLGTEMPCAPAAQMMARFTGVQSSPATARRLTEVVGRASAAIQHAEIDWRLDEVPPVPEGPERAVVSVDGAMGPVRGGEWAEVTTLVGGEEAGGEEAAPRGPDVRTRAWSSCSRLADVEQLNEAVLGELHQRGIERAGPVAAVSDGAEWIQGFLDVRCPEAVRILDFAPAAQRLAVLGQQCSARRALLTTRPGGRHACSGANATGLSPLLAEGRKALAALPQPPPEGARGRRLAGEAGGAVAGSCLSGRRLAQRQWDRRECQQAGG